MTNYFERTDWLEIKKFLGTRELLYSAANRRPRKISRCARRLQHRRKKCRWLLVGDNLEETAEEEVNRSKPQNGHL